MGEAIDEKFLWADEIELLRETQGRKKVTLSAHMVCTLLKRSAAQREFIKNVIKGAGAAP